MKETIYLAYFENYGYYAKHQPNYQWSYTDNALDANEYKTRDGALERIKGGSKFYKHNGKIVTIEKQFTIVGEESFSGQTFMEIRTQTKKAAKEEAQRQKLLKSREDYIKKLESEKQN